MIWLPAISHNLHQLLPFVIWAFAICHFTHLHELLPFAISHICLQAIEEEEAERAEEEMMRRWTNQRIVMMVMMVMMVMVMLVMVVMMVMIVSKMFPQCVQKSKHCPKCVLKNTISFCNFFHPDMPKNICPLICWLNFLVTKVIYNSLFAPSPNDFLVEKCIYCVLCIQGVWVRLGQTFSRARGESKTLLLWTLKHC